MPAVEATETKKRNRTVYYQRMFGENYRSDNIRYMSVSPFNRDCTNCGAKKQHTSLIRTTTVIWAQEKEAYWCDSCLATLIKNTESYFFCHGCCLPVDRANLGEVFYSSEQSRNPVSRNLHFSHAFAISQPIHEKELRDDSVALAQVEYYKTIDANSLLTETDEHTKQVLDYRSCVNLQVSNTALAVHMCSDCLNSKRTIVKTLLNYYQIVCARCSTEDKIIVHNILQDRVSELNEALYDTDATYAFSAVLLRLRAQQPHTDILCDGDKLTKDTVYFELKNCPFTESGAIEDITQETDVSLLKYFFTELQLLNMGLMYKCSDCKSETDPKKDGGGIVSSGIQCLGCLRKKRITGDNNVSSSHIRFPNKYVGRTHRQGVHELKFFKDTSDNYALVGIEIETEYGAYLNPNDSKEFTDRLLEIKSDGSIASWGMELLTQPASGKELVKTFTDTFKMLKEMGWIGSRATGQHNHVDFARPNERDLKQVVIATYLLEPLISQMIAPSRRTNTYSIFLNRTFKLLELLALNEASTSKYISTHVTGNNKLDPSAQLTSPSQGLKLSTNGRYMGLNLHSVIKRETVEFRYPHTAIDADKSIEMALFFAGIVEFSRSVDMDYELIKKDFGAFDTVETAARLELSKKFFESIKTIAPSHRLMLSKYPSAPTPYKE